MTLTADQRAEIDAARAPSAHDPAADRRRRWRRSCTRRSRCSTTASSASSTTWATTPPSCRRRACPTARAPSRVSDDAGLIHYLMRHRHTTPFEMCEIKFHVKLPIFVARQWIRHRTANVNEYSARYSILDREFYVPGRRRSRRAVRGNRQGRGEVLEGAEAARVLELLREDAATLLRPLRGDAERGRRRQAPATPAGRPRPRAGADEPDADHLHPVVLEDRPAQPAALPAAARRRARPVRDPRLRRGDAGDGRRWVPITYEAFVDHRLGGAQLSAKALAVVRRMLAGETPAQETSGLGKREWRELMATLGKV